MQSDPASSGLDAKGDAPGITTVGVSVQPDRTWRIASLRYFDDAGSFAAELAELVGGPLPRPLQALHRTAAYGAAQTVLAWRSPTETWLLSSSAEHIAAVEQRAAGRTDGCCIEQTGGISMWKVSGERTADFLARLGASVMPAQGEARTARLADLSVTTVCVRPAEIMLLVDRAYGPHLLGWMRETVADF